MAYVKKSQYRVKSTFEMVFFPADMVPSCFYIFFSYLSRTQLTEIIKFNGHLFVIKTGLARKQKRLDVKIYVKII